jgi:hypothetical protein
MIIQEMDHTNEFINKWVNLTLSLEIASPKTARNDSQRECISW